jgi:hypothetical protein
MRYPRTRSMPSRHYVWGTGVRRTAGWQDEPLESGLYATTSTVNYGTYSHSPAVTTDTYGGKPPWPDGPLSILVRRIRPARIVGRHDMTYYSSISKKWWTDCLFIDCTPPSVRTDYQAGTGALPVAPTDTWLINQALDRANPNQPKMDVTVSITELVDLPRMLRDVGTLLSRGISSSSIGGSYVSWNFGWAALLSDLRSVLKVVETIEGRLSRLRKLYTSSSSVHKTRMEVFRDRSDISLDQSVAIYGRTFRWTRETETEVRCWAMLKHRIVTDQFIPNVSWEQAARLAYRTDIDAATIWTRFPWMWLIDWFVDIRTLLRSFRNTISWEATSMNLMTHQRLRRYYRNMRCTTDGNGPAGNTLQFNDGSFLLERKRRSIHLNPQVRLAYSPMLSKHQLGLLASLVAGRTLPGRILHPAIVRAVTSTASSLGLDNLR